MSNELTLKPFYVASVSGGKDSLYMLRYILHHPTQYPLNAVVHFELDIDYPFIKNVIDYMEDECARHGILFYRFKPTHTWSELYEEYGFPSRVYRWCNSKYKLDAKAQMEKFLNEHGYYSVCYIGYCVDEEKRYTKRKGMTEVYPLVEAGIEEQYILEWARTQPIFNDFYKLFTRCGCMYCPMTTMKESAYIALKYPEVFKDIMEKASATEKVNVSVRGKPFSTWNGNPEYNTEYRVKRIMQYWLPKIKEELKNYEGGVTNGTS